MQKVSYKVQLKCGKGEPPPTPITLQAVDVDLYVGHSAAYEDDEEESTKGDNYYAWYNFVDEDKRTVGAFPFSEVLYIVHT